MNYGSGGFNGFLTAIISAIKMLAMPTIAQRKEVQILHFTN